MRLAMCTCPSCHLTPCTPTQCSFKVPAMQVRSPVLGLLVAVLAALCINGALASRDLPTSGRCCSCRVTLRGVHQDHEVLGGAGGLTPLPQRWAP